MCGIVAIFAYHPDAPLVEREELLRVRDAMAVRGPDGAGCWSSPDRRISLAHRRLAIIDLSDAATQPLATSDGQLLIVFNGEIYNYRQLRNELQGKGHRFHTDSDTEVLLVAWREFGERMVDYLRGMFAFAIWDEARRGLFLARDHFGIKPLYVHDDGKTLRVASQVKALIQGGAIDTAPNPAGHVGFFLWGSIPEPFTLHRRLHSFPAGCSTWVDASGPRVPQRFFDIAEALENASSLKSDSAPRESLRVALADSVRHHLLADVPVGLFLSSGLDSTTLTGIASETHAGLQAVTLGFDEFRNTANDEVPIAASIAAYYGCPHRVGRIRQQDFDENLAAILAAQDQPSIDGVNTWFVAREARRAGLKVAIAGLGGDELLGGYPGFRQIPAVVSRLAPFSHCAHVGKAFRVISAPVLRRFASPKYASLFEYGGSYGGAYLLRRGLFMPWELPGLLDPDMLREGWADLQPILHLDQWICRVKSSHAKVVALEMACYMRNMLLRDSDWAGMAHSLEIRVPLVDIDLFRAMAPHLAGPDPPSKRDLIGVPARSLPEEIVNRRKTGFSIPVQQWIGRAAQTGVASNARGLRGWAKYLADHAIKW